ncbi:MerR family transcriptional regulator [Henriciella sp.]|uniref:MerR family transcriptional regulator n=1 Tax=Henriciella sp. TaxID=1968823 RepID=UPI00260AADFF|nr:MerR family transcriptional regulator [Henriciella sp.]
MENLTIGQLAAAAGVGVETVRYYQRRGILKTPVPQTGSGSRRKIARYGKEDLRRLHFVRAAKLAGFTLTQISELLQLDASQDRERARQLAEERIGALDTMIEQLKFSRDALEKLARECANGEPGPCPILSTFEAGR